MFDGPNHWFYLKLSTATELFVDLLDELWVKLFSVKVYCSSYNRLIAIRSCMRLYVCINFFFNETDGLFAFWTKSHKLIKRLLRVYCSTILAWALEKTNNRGMPSFDVLYHAAWNSKANCHVRFGFNNVPHINGKCDRFGRVGGGRGDWDPGRWNLKWGSLRYFVILWGKGDFPGKESLPPPFLNLGSWLRNAQFLDAYLLDPERYQELKTPWDSFRFCGILDDPQVMSSPCMATCNWFCLFDSTGKIQGELPGDPEGSPPCH